MLESLLTTTATASVSIEQLLLFTLASLVLGIGIACIYMYRNSYTKSFVVTLALLPAMIQLVIMIVNGNLGTGVAVMGAFSLVRFRSVPGSAREISSIFFAMAVGLATGMGYLAIAILFTVIIGTMMLLLNSVHFGERDEDEKELKIIIPENLDYSGLFDDLFSKYTRSTDLVRVKTTNMGSLYELLYRVSITVPGTEKEFIDALRCRNGNLTIALGRVSSGRDEL